MQFSIRQELSIKRLLKDRKEIMRRNMHLFHQQSRDQVLDNEKNVKL